MSYKPVWLLDVDGVVNACPYKQLDYPTNWPESSWRFTRGHAVGASWPIHYSTELVDFINYISDRVEIRWHTTWQHDAIKLGAQLGLQAFSVQDAPHFQRPLIYPDDRFFWWKMFAAVDVVNKEERPLIWTDDDLNFEHRSVIVDEVFDKDKLCLITPSTEAGLSPGDCAEIELFVTYWENQ